MLFKATVVMVLLSGPIPYDHQGNKMDKLVFSRDDFVSREACDTANKQLVTSLQARYDQLEVEIKFLKIVCEPAGIDL